MTIPADWLEPGAVVPVTVESVGLLVRALSGVIRERDEARSTVRALERQIERMEDEIVGGEP